MKKKKKYPKLKHYCADPIKELKPIEEAWPVKYHLQKTQGYKFSFMKPMGLWVCAAKDIEDISWLDFAIATNMDIEEGDRFEIEYEITLSDKANIALLEDEQAVEDFYLQFRYRKPANRLLEEYAINWCKVYKVYDGIIVSPYQHGIRRRFDWYYTWDCASGCLWNPDVINYKQIDKEVK